MTRVELFCERFLEACWLIGLALVPLYFDIYSTRVFEPDKTIFFRCLVVVMLVAQAVEWAHQLGSSGKAVAKSTGSEQALVSRVITSNPIFWPVMAVLATETLATVTSIVPWVSFYGSYQRMQGTLSLYLYIAFFFILVAHLRTSSQFRRLILVAMLTSLPISVYGIAQHLQLDPLPWGGDVTFRVTSTMGNAIFLAAYLIMIVPITAGRFLGALSRSRDVSLPVGSPRHSGVAGWALVVVIQLLSVGVPLLAHRLVPSLWWLVPVAVAGSTLIVATKSCPTPSRWSARAEALGLAALLALQVICVILTQSRGPWLGLLLAIIFFAILIQIARRVKRRLLVGTLAAMILLGLFLVAFNLPSSPLAPFRGVPYIGRLGQLSEVNDGTGRVRVLIWQGTRSLLTDHPQIGTGSDPLRSLRTIVGYGPEAMRLAYNAVYPPELGDIEARNASPDRNHNDLLDHLVSSGVLGLIAYGFLVTTALSLGWRAIRRANGFEDAAIVVGLLAALVGHLGETQTGIAIVSTKLYFWTILALLTVVSLRPSIMQSLASSSILPKEPQSAPVTAPSRPRRQPKHSPVTVAAAHATSDSRPSLGFRRRVLVWSWFTAIVVGTHTLATLAFGAGSVGTEVWVYLSFLWVVLGAIAYGLSEVPSVRSAGWRRPEIVALSVGLLLAVAYVSQDLNRIAADVYHKQGTELDLQQRFAESVRAYSMALSLAPDQDYYALYLGRAFLNLGSHSTSQTSSTGHATSLDELTSLDANTLGKLDRGDAYAASEVALLRARVLSPLDPDHVANLARLYQFWGQSTDASKLPLAEKFASLASQLSPHSAQLLDEWAVVLLQAGKLVEAQEKANQAIQLDPPYAASHVILGDVYLERQDPADALVEHDKALAIDPNALADGTFDHRINLYIQFGKGAALAEMLGRVVATHPDRESRMAYAYVASKTGQLAVAIDQYRTMVSLDRSDWLAGRNLAIAYSQIGDRANARAAAEAALKAAPAAEQSQIRSLLTSLGTG